jgi:hypothetical protein
MSRFLLVPGREPAIAPDDEPPPPAPARRRVDRRAKVVLAVAAAAAVTVNAGAAWAYWRITGSETGAATADPGAGLTLRGRSDLNEPLRPGATGDLMVSVTNRNGFAVRVTSAAAGDRIVADDEHRDGGCRYPGVSLLRTQYRVSWDVPKNTVAAFAVPGVLEMTPGADAACAGATFTVPVRATGLTRIS